MMIFMLANTIACIVTSVSLNVVDRKQVRTCLCFHHPFLSWLIDLNIRCLSTLVCFLSVNFATNVVVSKTTSLKWVVQNLDGEGFPFWLWRGTTDGCKIFCKPMQYFQCWCSAQGRGVAIGSFKPIPSPNMSFTKYWRPSYQLKGYLLYSLDWILDKLLGFLFFSLSASMNCQGGTLNRTTKRSPVEHEDRQPADAAPLLSDEPGNDGSVN